VSMSQLVFNIRHDGHVHEVSLYTTYFTTTKSIQIESSVNTDILNIHR